MKANLTPQELARKKRLAKKRKQEKEWGTPADYVPTMRRWSKASFSRFGKTTD
jgi:hypothetical protein